MTIGYLLAILAAISNAASNVLQRKANRKEPPELSLSPKLIVDLVQDKVWLAGLVTVTLSFILMAAALGNGQLAAVQPIIVLELPMTLIAAAFVFKAKLHKREWFATGAMTLGLVGLIAFLSPKGGHAGSVKWWVWLIGLAGSYAVMGVLVLIGRGRQPAYKAALFGAATGMGFGVTAALMKGMTVQYQHGIVGLLSAWQTYLMIASGLIGMFLMQNALQAGRLVAAQPGITLFDPFLAIIWGTLVFQEKTRSGLFVLLAVLSGALMVGGALLLARSPLLEGEAGDKEQAGDGSDSRERSSRREKEPAASG